MWEEISRVHVPGVLVGEDKLLWRGTRDGIYTLASAYHLLAKDGTSDSRFWNLIWKANAPEKVRF